MDSEFDGFFLPREERSRILDEAESSFARSVWWSAKAKYSLLHRDSIHQGRQGYDTDIALRIVECNLALEDSSNAEYYECIVMANDVLENDIHGSVQEQRTIRMKARDLLSKAWRALGEQSAAESEDYLKRSLSLKTFY